MFAVIKTIGGFAKEDAPVASLVGVFTEEKVANQVKSLAGGGSQVVPVALDTLPPGLIQSAQALGYQLVLDHVAPTPAPAPATTRPIKGHGR